MSFVDCPLYKNFYRTCAEEIPFLLEIETQVLCESDYHKLCPLYKLIYEKRPHCEYFLDCAEFIVTNYINSPERFRKQNIFLLKDLDKFCFDLNNCVNCKLYKVREQGKSMSLEYIIGTKKIFE